LALNRKASDTVHTCGIQVALGKLSILEEGTETFPNARKNCIKKKEPERAESCGWPQIAVCCAADRCRHLMTMDYGP